MKLLNISFQGLTRRVFTGSCFDRIPASPSGKKRVLMMSWFANVWRNIGITKYRKWRQEILWAGGIDPTEEVIVPYTADPRRCNVYYPGPGPTSISEKDAIEHFNETFPYIKSIHLLKTKIVKIKSGRYYSDSRDLDTTDPDHGILRPTSSYEEPANPDGELEDASVSDQVTPSSSVQPNDAERDIETEGNQGPDADESASTSSPTSSDRKKKTEQCVADALATAAAVHLEVTANEAAERLSDDGFKFVFDDF